MLKERGGASERGSERESAKLARVGKRRMRQEREKERDREGESECETETQPDQGSDC